MVYHDLLNYGVEHQAKFVKQYGDFSVGIDALTEYNREVKSSEFPDGNYTYKKRVMDEDTK